MLELSAAARRGLRGGLFRKCCQHRWIIHQLFQHAFGPRVADCLQLTVGVPHHYLPAGPYSVHGCTSTMLGQCPGNEAIE
eukprot:1324353-Pyramimonas_sp.AAC.1